MITHFVQNMRIIDALCETPFAFFCCHISLIRNIIKCLQLEFDMTSYVLESVLKYRKNKTADCRKNTIYALKFKTYAI